MLAACAVAAWVWVTGSALAPRRPASERVAVGALAACALAWLAMLAGALGMGMLGSVPATAGIALAIAAAGLLRRPPLRAARPPLVPLIEGSAAALLVAAPGLLRPVSDLAPSRGDMIWHAAWIHQLADGMAAPGGVYAGEPNSYPWLYHALAAWIATALPGGTSGAIAALELFGLACAGTGMWLLTRELGARPAAAGWSVVLFLAAAPFGWLGESSPRVHAPIPALGLGPFRGDPMPALTPALAYLPPMIPRDLGLALAPVALWLAVAAVNGRVAWWRAGVAGGLVFLASPLAGLFCALWFAALALVSRSRRAWPAAIAGAVVSAVWVVPLAISYHRYHGVVRIATLAPVTPTGAQAITGLGLALPLGAAGLALLRRRRTRGFAAVAVLAALPLAAVVLLATAPGESVVSHGMPPALVRWYRDLPFVVLALCVPAGVAADALMGLLARRARPFLVPAAATLVTFVCGSSVLASATVWREPYRTDVACSPLPLDAHTRVAVIAPEPAADYLSMTLFGRSGAGFYDVGQRSAKVRFRRWVGDHIPDLAARGTAVLGALDGGPLPTGVDLVFARPQQVRGLGRPVATCTWRGHRWELAPPAG